jgi:hypothetical protein
VQVSTIPKTFENTKPRFNHFFRAAGILTNFLHRRRKNMEVVDNGLYEVGEDDADVYGWYEGE